MQYTAATADDIKRAQTPHNLFISGLFAFDLLMTPAILALKIGMIGLFIPLILSSGLIAFIYLRSKRSTSWFVDAHWRLAYSRGLLLLMGYAVSAALIFFAWLISLTAKTPDMGHIIWTALTRVALMPTLIMVMVTSVMEFGATALATKREVPDKLAAKFPPPAA
jgi:hypothetical protein